MSLVKQGAKAVLPKLRFPEFRETSGWTETSLGEVAVFHKGRGISKADLDVNGTLPCIRYGELYTRYGEVIDAVLSKTSIPVAELFLSRKYDVIIPSSGETKEDIATASCVLLDGVALGSDLNVIRSSHNGVFLSYFLNGSKRREIARVAQGNAVVHLYPSQLGALHVSFPEEAEQQKIADCLTSLDEVIAAQGRKVEALNAHKRGLMQKFFAREGEARPRIRLPEFGDAPDWKADQVNKLISTITPSRKIPTSGYGAEGRLPIVDQSPDPICGWTDDLEATVDARGPLIVFGDHTCVLKLVDHAFAQGADGIKIISSLPCIEVEFLYYALQADPLSSSAYRRHFSLLQEKWVAFPEDLVEQKCIVDCFSSLDAKITAESNYHAAMKTHRRGLVQQLFPCGEGKL